jgi:glycosyltransferase involved in cell wall biosynthesis
MDDTVDVVLLTKNSERVLEKCLDSVYSNVPVKQLIVVDAYSVDKTLDIVRMFNEKYGNVKIIFDCGTRATARQKGIENVESEWFLFIDSDVVLCRNWYQKATKYIDNKVGAVWGTEVWSTIQNPSTLKMFLLVTRKIFDARGGTHDTLIRTSTVKDIHIPWNLHVFEDAYIKDWITSKRLESGRLL